MPKVQLNAGSHPHSIHFHGIHAASMDGIDGAGMVEPGGEFTYELSAKPFGNHCRGSFDVLRSAMIAP